MIEDSVIQEQRKLKILHDQLMFKFVCGFVLF